jgi:hypothetical protein
VKFKVAIEETKRSFETKLAEHKLAFSSLVCCEGNRLLA